MIDNIDVHQLPSEASLRLELMVPVVKTHNTHVPGNGPKPVLHSCIEFRSGKGEESSASAQLRIRRRRPSARHTPSPARVRTCSNLKRTRSGSAGSFLGCVFGNFVLSLLTALYSRRRAWRPGSAPSDRFGVVPEVLSLMSALAGFSAYANLGVCHLRLDVSLTFRI